MNTNAQVHPSRLFAGSGLEEAGLHAEAKSSALDGVSRATAASGLAVTENVAMAAQQYYKVAPQTTAFLLDGSLIAQPSRGYAVGGTPRAERPVTAGSSQAATRATATGDSPKTGTAQARTGATAATSSKATISSSSGALEASKSELGFLDDKRLSIEDKLFQFMALMQKKADKELEDAMKDYAAKKEAAKSAGSGTEKKTEKTEKKSSGGGFFDIVGDVIGGIGDAITGLGGELLGAAESLAKDFGGPLLAAAATAVGAPFLAPVALEIGGSIGPRLVEEAGKLIGIGSSSGGSSSSSGSSTASKPSGSATSGTTEAFDEKLAMANIQRLVEKETAMFAALSNVMRAMHDAQMIAVSNIR